MPNIDHIVYATPDLEQGIIQIEKLLGVRAKSGGRHPSLGTANALISLGPEMYLEIIGPDPDGAKSGKPQLFGIDRLLSPRLVTWVAASKDLESLAKNAEDQGISVGKILSGYRVRPDGVKLTWRFTDPSLYREGGIVPFFIDWGQTPHPSTDAPHGGMLTGLRAEHPEQERLSKALHSLALELPVLKGDKPSLIATIRTADKTVELR